MTDKTFKILKCEMGLSPATMVDCLGLTIIAGISYTQIENGVGIGEGLGKNNFCKAGVVLMAYEGTAYS